MRKQHEAYNVVHIPVAPVNKSLNDKHFKSCRVSTATPFLTIQQSNKTTLFYTNIAFKIMNKN